MDASDFENLASKLVGAVGRRYSPREIMPVDLLDKARAMMKRGYVHTPDTLRVLEAYMQGYGILLSGGLGIGKSFFFEVVNPEPVAVLSFNRCHLWKYDQLEKWLDDHTGVEVVLDDIGWDADKANNFGTKYEVLQVVLDHRLTESGCRTHITTNLSNDELVAKYDGHLVDRVYQLCKCFALPPRQSLREPQPDQIYLKNNEYARVMGKEVL